MAKYLRNKSVINARRVFCLLSLIKGGRLCRSDPRRSSEITTSLHWTRFSFIVLLHALQLLGSVSI